MTENDITEILIKDIVRLSLITSRLLKKGIFKGEDAPEVAETLSICDNVLQTFVENYDEIS